MSEDIQVMVPVTITGQQVNDLLLSAFESSCWIEEICLFDRNDEPTINCTNPIQNLNSIVIYADAWLRSVRHRVSPEKTHTLLMPPSTDLEKGLKVMADEYPNHFANLISGNGIKSHTANVFLQCCLFGKVSPVLTTYFAREGERTNGEE